MSSRNVYDLCHPSPASLEHFACNALAFDLWRFEIKHYLKSDGTFCEYDPQRKTSLHLLTPYIPQNLYSKIERYADCRAKNVHDWLRFHAALMPPKYSILNHFTDFVCDHDGAIDYTKTAKRLLLCDALDDYQKFLTASLYCFEEDIARLWPAVSSRLSGMYFDARLNPVWYYWTLRMDNRLSEITLDNGESSVDEVILNAIINIFTEHKWPSLEYFLNRLSLEDRSRYMLKMLDNFDDPQYGDDGDDYDRKLTFFQYFLPKLDEETVLHLVTTRGDELMTSTLSSCRFFVWEYIKDKMTPERFLHLVKFILRDETESETNWRELWPLVPSDLKRSIIPDVLQNSGRLFDKFDSSLAPYFGSGSISDHRQISSLSFILSDTPVEYRKKFWNENWHILMEGIKMSDLRDLMNLCFEDDQCEIMQVKRDALSFNHDQISKVSSTLLRGGCFEDLEEFLAFWYVNDELAIRDVRLKLLHENMASVRQLVENARLLNEFIDKAYLDVDLATNFKNQLIVSPQGNVIDGIINGLWCGDFRQIMEFFDTFVQSETLATQIKEESIVPKLVSLLHTGDHFLLRKFNGKEFADDFNAFMNWLLRTDDRIMKFKETLDVDAIVLRSVEYEKKEMIVSNNGYYIDNVWFRKCFEELKLSDLPLKTFLKWYFVTEENFNEFANKYADNEAFIQLMTKSI